MKFDKPTTIDFETFGIMRRPDYPPKPVGCAIKRWGKPGEYLAWGHVNGGNNITQAKAYDIIRQLWLESTPLLMQNALFDVDVAETHVGVVTRPWQTIHDTKFLLFEHDPDGELSLKPAAEKLLGMKPDEQSKVRDWLVKNQPVSGVRITESNFGAYIAYAPGTIVGKYAIGDCVRTEKLYAKLMPEIIERGMLADYDRERALLPVVLLMERTGMRVDDKRLAHDIDYYTKWMNALDAWLQRKLNAPDLNVNSNQQLAQALVAAGFAKAEDLGLTKTGKLRSSKDVLEAAITDDQLFSTLRYRGALKTRLGTFMRPWLATAQRTGGVVYTRWNQVKDESDKGARTGRLSSSPNLQNVPKHEKVLFKRDTDDVKLKRRKPSPPLKLPTLPKVRSYIVPWDKDHVLLDRDYSQQELRILAHFEDGALADAYRADPWLDIHRSATDMINKMLGTAFSRTLIKTVGFAIIYGAGEKRIAAQADCEVPEARAAKRGYLAALPGIKDVQNELYARAARQEPCRTWGGGEFYCEKPAIVKGRVATFEYKMLNYLIQRSAAQCTKEGCIRFVNALREAGLLDKVKFYLTVHDELLVSAHKSVAHRVMALMRTTMESVEFDVPMLSEGKWSTENWAALTVYDEKGVEKWNTSSSKARSAQPTSKPRSTKRRAKAGVSSR